MKLLLTFCALLAIAHSAPADFEAPVRSIRPIDSDVLAPEGPVQSDRPIDGSILVPEGPVKSDRPIEGSIIAPERPVQSDRPIFGGGYIPAATPNIDINIIINGVPTPYYEQKLVYIQILDPKQPPQLARPEPPQIAVPGFEILPYPDGEAIPDSGPIYIQ